MSYSNFEGDFMNTQFITLLILTMYFIYEIIISQINRQRIYDLKETLNEQKEYVELIKDFTQIINIDDFKKYVSLKLEIKKDEFCKVIEGIHKQQDTQDLDNAVKLLNLMNYMIEYPSEIIEKREKLVVIRNEYKNQLRKYIPDLK